MQTDLFPSTTRLWRIRLLDGPVLENLSGQTVRRFRSQRVGALLAYLALRLGRPCPREEIYSALWPDEFDQRVTANRLRVTLASLRRQLEPQGVLFGTVLDVTEQGRIRLRAEAAWCDVTAIDEAVRADQREAALRLLNGSLLPGYYDEWILQERTRLELLRDELEPLRASFRPYAVSQAPQLRHLSDGRAADLIRNLSPLPGYLTRFFGRSDEILRIEALLRDNRLVTLTGSGGMGKTRLAAEALRVSSAPVVWVSLAETRVGGSVAEAILDALGVAPSLDLDPLDQVEAVLRQRPSVILALDNAETHSDQTAAVAMRLLAGVPDLAVLVTSRQSLNVSGEVVLLLGPMESPSSEAPSEVLLDVPAVALFVDRARGVRSDFRVTPRHIVALMRICRLTEGLPLSLELAAARIVTQTPSQIADSLETGLLNLASHQHGFAGRHRSLRASIHGSFELLAPETKSFFAALSVFQGGWTMEAAHVVTGCDQAEAYLGDLARRSLVQLQEDETTGLLRGAFLESIRQFAAEQIPQLQRAVFADRHAAYYLDIAGSASDDDIETIAPLDSDQENLLVAVKTGYGSKDRKHNARFWRGLRGALVYAHVRGRSRVFLPWAEFALQSVSEAPGVELRTGLRMAAYAILSYSGQLERLREISEDIRRDAEAHDNTSCLLRSRVILIWVTAHSKEFDTFLRLADEVLHEVRLLDEPELLRLCLRTIALNVQHYGLIVNDCDPELAANAFRKSEALARECLTLLPEGSTHLTYVHNVLAGALQEQGKMDDAYAHTKAAQRTALTQGMNGLLLFTFRNEYRFAVSRAQWEYAALLHGAYIAMRERTGYVSATSMDIEPPPAALILGLSPERYELLIKRGREIDPWRLAGFTLDRPPTIDADGDIS